uniref:ADP,ATP carrier protein n=1 Tax=Odontella aurita TaxID=265563 RepID=A0A7S4HIM4_9STRA|mmetsp:Transcript_10597/g.31267  ORF Transcript_10597/g.31267 Transcript_10597/m.31267 type:complete len:190 (+) Transcript_10597:469-1038(+)
MLKTDAVDDDVPASSSSEGRSQGPRRDDREGEAQEQADLPPATALQDLIAGGLSGSASVVVGHPFDTYKVRLQTSSASSGKAGASSKQFGGVMSLYRGMAAPLATAAVVNAMIFSAFGESSRYWDECMGKWGDQRQQGKNGTDVSFLFCLRLLGKTSSAFPQGGSADPDSSVVKAAFEYIDQSLCLCLS